MPIPSTPSIMPNVLGYAADTVQIPETTPTGQGIPSFRDLFPFITQVDPDAGGVMVERAWMNALFNLLGQHAFFQQSGCVYPWQATLNYIAGSHVKGSDDVEYIALQPSGPDVSGTGAKDPAQQANRAYWVSLASFVSGGLVPNSRRVIAGTGLTGGGPLSADVTLAAKLTDSVNTTDSTTAASATAVKAAYDRGTEALTEARQKVSKTLDDATGTLPLTNGGTGRTDGQCPAAQALLLNGTFGGVQAKLLWSAQDAVTYLLGANPEGTGLYPILPNKVVVGEATVSSICKGVVAFTGNHPQYLPSAGTWKGFTCPAQSGDLFFCGVKSGGDVVTNPTGALQYGLYVRTA